MTGRRNFALSIPARYGVFASKLAGLEDDGAAELGHRFEHVHAR